MKSCLHPSELAPGLMLGHEIELGERVELGANVVVHSGTRIRDGCKIEDGVVLGKLPKLSSGVPERDDSKPLVVEEGAAICCGSVAYAGAHIGPRAIIGDQVQLRERSVVGEGTVIGRGTSVENDVQIGAGVRIQSNCCITANTVVEDEVFVAPGVVTTNDDTMGRHDAGYRLRGPVLRRRCRVGGGVLITPGIVVGEEAFVAAGAVLTKDVPPRAVMMGVPARQVREVADEDLWARWT